jgi:hypothetical protein
MVPRQGSSDAQLVQADVQDAWCCGVKNPRTSKDIQYLSLHPHGSWHGEPAGERGSRAHWEAVPSLVTVGALVT